MKIEIIFLAAVLGIAAIHLLFRMVNYLAGFKRASVRENRKAEAYDDWYVFFKKSALYGDTAVNKAEPAVANLDGIASDPTCQVTYQTQESFS